MKTRIDAFQIRGLRHILKIEHSFWSHTKNEEILARANAIAWGEENHTANWQQFIQDGGRKKQKIKLVSVLLEERKRTLLGHIMRTSTGDPLFQVCFDGEHGTQHLYETRRVGRPRNHWVRETMKDTHAKIFQGQPYIEDDEDIILRMFCAATTRLF